MCLITQLDRKWINGPKKRRKPRKQTVYVLTGSVAYENTNVLGVFTSRKRAEARRETHAADRNNHYDYYSVDGIVVNSVN